MRVSPLRLPATLAAAAVLLLAVPSAASARDYPTPVTTGRGNQCVVHLEPVTPSGPEARPTSITCFRTFRAAIAHATRGYTQLSRTAGPADLTQAMLPGDASAATAVVIGVEYNADHWRVSSGTWIVETSGECTASRGWVWRSMPSGWDNVISSSKAYSGCNRADHWENADLKGALRSCRPNCYYIGDAMNDRTSSLGWWH